MQVHELFDECALEYDKDRPKIIPDFEGFYGAAMAMIPFGADAAINVLDLGSGTGLFAAMVARAYPLARLHLVDLSEGMLAQARERFNGDARVSFGIMDYRELADVARYDLVISALSIHHLADGDKRELFKKIFSALKPGGMFVHADQALGVTEAQEAEFEQQWLAHVQKSGLDQVTFERALERKKAAHITHPGTNLAFEPEFPSAAKAVE